MCVASRSPPGRRRRRRGRRARRPYRCDPSVIGDVDRCVVARRPRSRPACRRRDRAPASRAPFVTAGAATARVDHREAIRTGRHVGGVRRPSRRSRQARRVSRRAGGAGSRRDLALQRVASITETSSVELFAMYSVCVPGRARRPPVARRCGSSAGGSVAHAARCAPLQTSVSIDDEHVVAVIDGVDGVKRLIDGDPDVVLVKPGIRRTGSPCRALGRRTRQIASVAVARSNAETVLSKLAVYSVSLARVDLGVIGPARVAGSAAGVAYTRSAPSRCTCRHRTPPSRFAAPNVEHIHRVRVEVGLAWSGLDGPTSTGDGGVVGQAARSLALQFALSIIETVGIAGVGDIYGVVVGVGE